MPTHAAHRLRIVLLVFAQKAMFMVLLWFTKASEPTWRQLSVWDGGWYREIALAGYSMRRESAAFFPLFPRLARHLTALLFAHVTEERIVWTGLSLSFVAFIVAAVALFELTAKSFGPRAGYCAIALLLASPDTIFFSSFYTESLFLCLACLAFSTTGIRNALITALASLSRPPGVFLAVAAACNRVVRQRYRRSMWLSLFPLGVLGVSGILWHMRTLQAERGDPLAFRNIQSSWGRSGMQSPWDSLLQGLQNPDYIYRIDALLMIFSVGVMVWSYRARRYDWTVFLLLGTLVPASTGSVMSFSRFFFAYPPVYALLGARLSRSPAAFSLVFALFVMWATVLVERFVTVRWAG